MAIDAVVDPKKEETTVDTDAQPNEVEAKVISQIEYYFGDINLRRDKFLRGKIEENEGWVPLEVLLTFNRLKAICNDPKVIIAALRKSKSNLLEVEDEAEAKIRRLKDKPVPEWNDDIKREFNERTIHMKGFPLDTTLDQITEFCSQYGKVESVEMRKIKDTKEFKGCAMVTFATKEEANKVLACDKKFTEDLPLQRENKVKYFERKAEFYETRKKKKLEGKKSNGKEEDEAEETKKAKDANGEKVTESKEKAKKESGDEEEKDEDIADEEEKEAEEEESAVEMEGAVIKLIGIPKEIKYQDIKDVFKKHGDVQFVDIKDDTREGHVRFSSSGAAKAALELAKVVKEGKTEESAKKEKEGEEKEGENKETEEEKPEVDEDKNGSGDAKSVIKVDIKGKSIEAVVLEGEEEETYWKAVKEIREKYKNKNFKDNRRGGGRGRGKGFRGGRGGRGGRGKKRSGGDFNFGRKNKQMRTD